MSSQRHPSSFRDPSGFVFVHNGEVHRQINEVYREHFELLLASGLYESLVTAGRMVAHEDASLELRQSDQAFKIIKPDPVPFISYPYEWSFSQLKDAALLTLSIQRTAIEKGLSLKDASAYNVQFVGCRPVFIDTLSFEPYREGRPWVAYKQFCQHFLAPLALMARVDVRLNQLLKGYIDGIPVDLASRLLPARSWGRFSLAMHIHLHARSQRRYADKPVKGSSLSVSKQSLVGLLESLRGAIKSLDWTPAGTEWADYYSDTNYTSAALDRKAALVDAYIERIAPRTVWDLGANTGRFSRLATGRNAITMSFDYDPAAVDRNYRAGYEEKDWRLLPLALDLTNPSPGIGWENTERMSLIGRGPCDAAFALALVHHLAIGNNTPFDSIAAFLSRICSWLVIEFVPKQDSQVQRLLASREDIFDWYTRPAFEEHFRRYFSIEDVAPIEGTERTLYLMKCARGDQA